MIETQRVDFIGVPVQDRERAADFYEHTLGLRRNPNWRSGDWIEFETGTVTLALVTPEQMLGEYKPLPWGTIVFRVPDVEAAKEKLRTAGVEVGDTWDSGSCNGAPFRDPDGNGLMLHHRYKPYPDGTEP